MKLYQRAPDPINAFNPFSAIKPIKAISAINAIDAQSPSDDNLQMIYVICLIYAIYVIYEHYDPGTVQKHQYSQSKRGGNRPENVIPGLVHVPEPPPPHVGSQGGQRPVKYSASAFLATKIWFLLVFFGPFSVYYYVGKQCIL